MRTISLLTIGFAFVASTAAAQTPAFIRGEIRCTTYNGVDNDLLTAGLGKSGLQGAAPLPVVAASPTAAELRKLAIYNNYRALVDITTNGGYGRLYGPNIDPDGADTLGDGKVAGEECLAFADDGTGRRNVTLMVQIPLGNAAPARNFDPASPCIVAAPSSGSRGVYGAIGTAGEAGLKLGCAVAYTDKGTGMGVHDLQGNTVNTIDGLRADADLAGHASNFTADVTSAERTAFNGATSNRFAFKHAHSQQNPEQDWGRNVLQAIELALFQLNRHDPRVNKTNTIVIASSVSNGGGASLLAAQQDDAGLIDGVAVGEPQIQPRSPASVHIKRGNKPVAADSKPLFDYTTLANLYQPCASLAAALAASPLRALIDPARAAARCQALRDARLLHRLTVEAQADEALAVLRDAGWEPDSDLIHASHWALATPAIAVTYANAYGRSSVLDNLCGFSFGATTAAGVPTAAAAAAVAQIFANGNGIPPTSGINIINNNSVGGALIDALSFSPNGAATGVQDYNTPGALCLRNLFDGSRRDRDAERVRQGIAQVQATGSLGGKPTLIVHGRADALVPVNHSSRPFVALNQRVEGDESKLRYYEVTNAQHFDAFLGLAGYDTRFIPLHVYFNRAVKLMYDHLKSGAVLPPSQVVRTVPRGGTPGAAPAITANNLPPIRTEPEQADRIRMLGSTLRIPD